MFRVTIRDVLWLTVVAGLLIGWWLSSRSEDRRREPLVSRIAALRQELIQAREYGETLAWALEMRDSGYTGGMKYVLVKPSWEVIDDPLDESISVGRPWPRAD
jgi:hypothetical protein